MTGKKFVIIPLFSIIISTTTIVISAKAGISRSSAVIPAKAGISGGGKLLVIRQEKTARDPRCRFCKQQVATKSSSRMTVFKICKQQVAKITEIIIY